MDRPHARWAETCTYCPTLCLFACPVSNAEGRDTVTPWGKMSLARWVDRGVEPMDGESAEVFYACLGCLACHTPCRHDVEVPEVLFAARARAVEAGVSPYGPELFQPDEDTLLSVLRAHVPADRWLDHAQVLFLPGVDTLRDTPDVVDAVFELADRLDLDYLAAGHASALDCGYGLWSAGHETEFARVMARTSEALAPYRKVVVHSPHSLYMLRVVYPQRGAPVRPNVEYMGDLLLPLVREAVAREGVPRPLGGRVRYHDPCYLGRHQAIYDSPRALLEAVAGAAPGELRWHHETSYCCGGGGGLDVTAPTSSAAAARTVTDNAHELGTDLLATACGSCGRQLRAAIEATPGENNDGPAVRRSPMRSRDVVTLVAEALRRP